MVAIIVVNWNGCGDTLECLASLGQSSYRDYFTVVCDNGSADGSLQRIAAYCSQAHIACCTVSLGSAAPSEVPVSGSVVCYDLGANHGFSRANNLGIALASTYRPDYYLLLNNDTVVTPAFLQRLVDFQQCHRRFRVLTPLICYNDDRRRVWNGGGNIYWGFRRYHYGGKPVTAVPGKAYVSCTFITGCALFFVPSLLDAGQRLFTEKFFFGEEDFEFCLRMKQAAVPMACVLPSIIYHKVARSRRSMDAKRLTYIYYLNRLINMRSFMPRWQYGFYRQALFLSAVRVLRRKYGMSLGNIGRFLRRLAADAAAMDGVSRQFFLQTCRQV